MIGAGALGPQAAGAIRHVAVQNGVWSLGNFGGVPPRSALSFYNQVCVCYILNLNFFFFSLIFFMILLKYCERNPMMEELKGIQAQMPKLMQDKFVKLKNMNIDIYLTHALSQW